MPITCKIPGIYYFKLSSNLFGKSSDMKNYRQYNKYPLSVLRKKTLPT